MPLTKLAPDTQLDPPPGGGLTKLPPDTRLDEHPSALSRYLTGSLESVREAGRDIASGAGDIAKSLVPGFDPRPGTERLGEITTFLSGGLVSPLSVAGPVGTLTRVARGAAETGELNPIRTLGAAITQNRAEAAEQAITSLYARGVRPSIAGKGTFGAVEGYNAKARDAISSIVANKPNLSFDNGAVTGELPKSLAQFSEAVEQTKGRIFKEYDALAKQAGDRGAVVPLRGIVDELEKLADTPAVKDLHPEIRDYARARAVALAGRGVYSVSDAQQAVQQFNQSLQSFYRNPSYESASRASVDAMIANQLRRGLDTTIESATAPGYQALKNQYGSLKTIENDVVKAAQRDARSDAGGGLLNTIANALSAEELARGIFTFDPAAIASSVGIKAAARYMSSLRSPNRAIERMFQTAERQPP